MAELEQDRQQLLASVDAALIDNTEELILPATLRALLYKLIYSGQLKLDPALGPNLRPDLWKS